FGEDMPGHVALVLLRRPGVRATVQRLRVGAWHWEVVTARSLDDVVALGERSDLERAVIRLVLDMTISIPDRHRLERLLRELKGTENVHERVGILQIDRTELRTAAEVRADDFPTDLPQVLRGTVERLQQRVAAAPGPERERALRALTHLWKLVQKVA